MANCKRCAFYTKDGDELQRAHDDILVIGEENDHHFCFAYTPIPDGVFEGDKDCPHYTPRDGGPEERRTA